MKKSSAPASKPINIALKTFVVIAKLFDVIKFEAVYIEDEGATELL